MQHEVRAEVRYAVKSGKLDLSIREHVLSASVRDVS
jgi:hypothetical protein